MCTSQKITVPGQQKQMSRKVLMVQEGYMWKNLNFNRITLKCYGFGTNHGSWSIWTFVENSIKTFIFTIDKLWYYSNSWKNFLNQKRFIEGTNLKIHSSCSNNLDFYPDLNLIFNCAHSDFLAFHGLDFGWGSSFYTSWPLQITTPLIL